jgi:site-specific DNA-methyltransferase (adenine-specific)
MNATLDHRHNYASYRQFILRVLVGIEKVLARNGVAAVVIGDVADPGKEPVPLAAKIWGDIGGETSLQLLDLIEDDLPADKKVSRIWGETKGQATDRDCVLVVTPNGSSATGESGTVEWDEPYKDGGPDAAHARLKRPSNSVSAK